MTSRFVLPPPTELDRIERQLAAALARARQLGWLGNEGIWGAPEAPEPVHPSPVYAELERLSLVHGVRSLDIHRDGVVASEDMDTNRIAS